MRRKAAFTCVMRRQASTEITPVGMLSKMVSMCRRRSPAPRWRRRVHDWKHRSMAAGFQFFGHAVEGVNEFANSSAARISTL